MIQLINSYQTFFFIKIFFEPKDTTKASILYPKRSEADDLESLM